MSRTKRKDYTGSKAVSPSCRDGSCPWCKNNREYKVKKAMKPQEERRNEQNN